MKLAIQGGEPIRKRSWPKWPIADKNTERNILDVLHSDRWAISGVYNGRKPYERRFAEAFFASAAASFIVEGYGFQKLGNLPEVMERMISLRRRAKPLYM